VTAGSPDRFGAAAVAFPTDVATDAAAAQGTRRIVVAVGLLALSVGAWSSVAALGGNMSMSVDIEHALTMGMELTWFAGMWALMMVAMMLPAAAPFLVGVGQTTDRTASGAHGRTAIIALAYIAAWTAIGAILYALAMGAGSIASRSSAVVDSAGRIAGAVVLLVGLYEVSPLKAACLEHCRDIPGLVEQSLRGPGLGAASTGLGYARFCVGCSLPLCILLFPVGLMSLAAMGVVMGLIVVEKTTPYGLAVARVAGLALIVAGAAVLLHPAFLPTQVGLASAM
jgi:predicted metal-binding membrane protein